MRAGKLDRSIVVQRAAATVDAYGTEAQGFTTIATVRAQVIQSSTEEFIRAFGASEESTMMFRVRYREGFTPKDRVTYQGQAYDIVELKELGRRDGLDLRCKLVSS